MPVQVEDRLSCAAAYVDKHVVVVEPLVTSSFGDELQHLLRLVRRKLVDFAKRLDVSLGDHEQMCVRFRIDVADRYDSRASTDVFAFAVQPTKEAVVRQRGFPPRRL